jgi:hypothetical protein
VSTVVSSGIKIGPMKVIRTIATTTRKPANPTLLRAISFIVVANHLRILPAAESSNRVPPVVVVT